VLTTSTTATTAPSITTTSTLPESIVVESDSGASSVQGSGALPVTGANALAVAVVGLSAVGAGLMMIRMRRRTTA
jgi:LPXTG-motif cell wall-anchored protein